MVIKTAEEMYRYEKHIMKDKHVPPLLLMEGAAHAVYRQMQRTLPTPKKILAIAGTGNNGADAIAVARLYLLHGTEAEVLLIGDPQHASMENQQQQAIFAGYGGIIHTDPARPDLSRYTAIIDGLFGIGLNRPIQGTAARVITALNQLATARIYAIDVPSGIATEKGVAFTPCVRADETITFGFYKHGMEDPALAQYFGNIIVDDIGFFV